MGSITISFCGYMLYRIERYLCVPAEKEENSSIASEHRELSTLYMVPIVVLDFIDIACSSCTYIC